MLKVGWGGKKSQGKTRQEDKTSYGKSKSKSEGTRKYRKKAFLKMGELRTPT